jgi:hypothetical protein
MIFLLPVLNVAGNTVITLHRQDYIAYSLHPANHFTIPHQHDNITADGMYVAAIPGITTPAGNQHSRSLPADSGLFKEFDVINRTFIFTLQVETFDNNQRHYNHPTHQFW